MNFKGIKAIVWANKFAIVKSKKPLPDSFAVIQDKRETTVVIDQKKLDETGAIETSRDWKIITFDAILDFGVVGFLAKISNALADEGISILVISSYSTDHILVKEKDLENAVNTLEKLNFAVEKK